MLIFQTKGACANPSRFGTPHDSSDDNARREEPGFSQHSWESLGRLQRSDRYSLDLLEAAATSSCLVINNEHVLNSIPANLQTTRHSLSLLQVLIQRVPNVHRLTSSATLSLTAGTKHNDLRRFARLASVKQRESVPCVKSKGILHHVLSHKGMPAFDLDRAETYIGRCSKYPNPRISPRPFRKATIDPDETRRR